MGLSKYVKMDSGIEIEDAYFRINRLDVSNKHVEIKLIVYVSREACVQNLSSLMEQSYSFIPDITDEAPSIFRQAYQYLKDNREFKEAEDVLEDGQTPLK